MTYRRQTNRQTYRHLVKICLSLSVGFFFRTRNSRFSFHPPKKNDSVYNSFLIWLFLLAVLSEEAFCPLLRLSTTYAHVHSLMHALSFFLSCSPLSATRAVKLYSLPSVLRVCSYHVSNPTCNRLIVRFFCFFFCCFFFNYLMYSFHPSPPSLIFLSPTFFSP